MRLLKALYPLVAFIATTVLVAQNKKSEPPKKETTVSVTNTAPEPTKSAATSTAEFSLFGTLGAAYAEGTYVLTCGGPKFGFKFGDLALYAGAFPSLVYSEVYKNFNAATPVRPNLGVGFELAYQRVSIITPIFYMPNNTYYYTLGLAYKFS